MAKHTLFITSPLEPEHVARIRAVDPKRLEVIYEPELTKESWEKHLPGVGILVVRSTEVTAAAIESAKQLHLIVPIGGHLRKGLQSPVGRREFFLMRDEFDLIG